MNTLQLLLSVWGAVLATVLGVLQLVKHFKDRPHILVNAELVFHAANRGAEVKGTLVETEHGPNEVLLLFTAANHGRQALQITACLIEQANGNLQQVIPAGLPALLEPNTRVQVEIQKEWLDDVDVVRLGVIDALGRIHEVEPSAVVRLVRRSNELPSNIKEYRHRETREIVEAFQAKDKVVLTRKNLFEPYR